MLPVVGGDYGIVECHAIERGEAALRDALRRRLLFVVGEKPVEAAFMIALRGGGRRCRVCENSQQASPESRVNF